MTLIRTARTTAILAILMIIGGGFGIYAIDRYSNPQAEYRVWWTGDATPDSITYLANGAAHTVRQSELQDEAGPAKVWIYLLPHNPGIHLHLEVTQSLPYHGITYAEIRVDDRVAAAADTRFGRKSIILDAD